MDGGEGAVGARDEQSLVSVGVGEGFHHADEGCHGRGSARRREAHDAAHTRNPSRRRARHPPGCPPAGGRSSGSGAETEVTRGAASAATGAEASAASRAWTRSRHGAGRRDVTGAGGGSPGRGPAERSVGGRGSAIDPGPGGRRGAFGRRGSR